MTTQEKAKFYDDLLYESDKLQRANSKLRSEHVTNIPPNIQAIIDENTKKLAILVGKLESLLR